jgi:glycine/D-amino acid oxidase-like deaminating enzyme
VCQLTNLCSFITNGISGGKVNHHRDVIVIGGGINGVSITFHLAKHGAGVTLLEKSFIAGGPSGVSSGIVRQHYSNPVTARMALESLKVWHNFPELVGGDAVFTKTGFLMSVPAEEVTALKANIALQQSVGINTRFVSTAELREIEPHLDTTGLGGGVYEPDSGYCDPNAAANGFSQAARRLGAQIKTGITAKALKSEGGKIVGIETDQGFFNTDTVILATGPWSPFLLETLGIEVPITTERVKVGLFTWPVDFQHHTVFADFITQVYLRPETGGIMLVGSISPEEEIGDQVPDPDQFNDKVGLDVLTSFAERVAQRYPDMNRSHLASSYASLYDITPDWHPIMDAVPGVDGLYICAGSSGHGFKLAPSVGKMMTKLVLEGKENDDDIHLFAWDRFSSRRLVGGQYEYSIIG